MGADASKPTEIQNIEEFKTTLNTIAAKFILETDFKNMLELQDPEKSKDLLILTQNIIEKELDKVLISYEKPDDGTTNLKKLNTTVYIATKEKVKNIKKDNKKKGQHKILATALAKRYLKIANIFAAIYVVIEPEFQGHSKKKEKLLRQEHLPRTSEGNPAKPAINFCQKRLQALIGKGRMEQEKGELKVEPAVCDFGVTGPSGDEQLFENEPGILELDNLYYDEYDPVAADFKKRSDLMNQKLKEDATAFFEAIKGVKLEEYNKTQKTPKVINSFADISMSTFYADDVCRRSTTKLAAIDDLKDISSAGFGSWRQDYAGSTKVFTDYGDHLRKMKETAETNYTKLITIIQTIFVTKDNKYTISSSLTDATLDTLIDETRSLISKMYIECASDFKKGVELFKAIVVETIKLQQTSITAQQTVSVEKMIDLAALGK